MTSQSTATDASFPQHVARFAESGPRWLARARRSGAALSDLYYEHTVHHQNTLRQRARPSGLGIPHWTQHRALVSGVGLRAWHGTAQGYASTDTVTDQALQYAADQAARELEGMERVPMVLDEQPVVQLEPSNLPGAPDAISLAEKQALMLAAADAALSWSPDVRQVNVRWQDRTRRFFLMNSSRTQVVDGCTLLGMQVEVVLEVEGRVVQGRAFAGSARSFFDFLAHDVEALGRAAVEQAQVRAHAQPMPPGTLPVILAGGWGGVWLHEAVGHSLEADVAGAEAVPGQVVAPQMVTLVDDATHPNGRGRFRCDDEGTPAQRTVLIDDGILKNVLTDRTTAFLHNHSRTGNARRQDYRFPPLPRMSNLILAPQPVAPEDLMADVTDGLYVETIGNGIVRPEDDTFVFDVISGYRIEQGRLTHPVTDVQVVGGPSTALSSLRGIANDFRLDASRGICKKHEQTVPIAVGMPTVLLTDLSLQPISSS